MVQSDKDEQKDVNDNLMQGLVKAKAYIAELKEKYHHKVRLFSRCENCGFDMRSATSSKKEGGGRKSGSKKTTTLSESEFGSSSLFDLNEYCCGELNNVHMQMINESNGSNPVAGALDYERNS